MFLKIHDYKNQQNKVIFFKMWLYLKMLEIYQYVVGYNFYLLKIYDSNKNYSNFLKEIICSIKFTRQLIVKNKYQNKNCLCYRSISVTHKF